MPVAHFSSGSITGTQDLLPRKLIPGVTPGGQFAGKAKPALLIKDMWLEVVNWETSAEDYHAVKVYLKLSQENDLTPGLILPIGIVHSTSVGATHPNAFQVEQLGEHASGTIWAPRVVGLRHIEAGTVTWNIRAYLSYEMVFLPWRDWFVHWEFLDGIGDNAREW